MQIKMHIIYGCKMQKFGECSFDVFISYAHQGCIYLIKNRIKTIIMWNINNYVKYNNTIKYNPYFVHDSIMYIIMLWFIILLEPFNTIDFNIYLFK